MPNFESIAPKDRLLYEVMPMLVGIGPDGMLLCFGTCFVALSHMAVTAKHVAEELLSKDPNIARGLPNKFEYWIIQILWDGDEHKYVVWTIDEIALCSHSDIAIIWLNALDENAAQHKRWKAIPITFDPPPIGAVIRAYGHHNFRFDGSRLNADGKLEHLELNSERSVATGVVKEHYWGGRDRGLYSFPCFEVDAKFEHGMSGGLVTNERGEVCGIVCGSLHASSANEDHVSYVTMLWPMLTTPVGPELVPNGIESEKYCLRDLSLRGVFTPYGWERVHFHSDYKPGNLLTIQYLMKT